MPQINFERGLKPYEALKIGAKHRENIKAGESFIAEFKIRKSCPEFYPLQRQKDVMVLALEDPKVANFRVTGCDHRSIRCRIGKIGDFFAFYDAETKIWIIE